jgi:hypothetical protein
MAGKLVEQDEDECQEHKGDDAVVEYDILLGFCRPVSFAEIGERFRSFSGMVEGTLVGIAMNKSINSTQWFLSTQWEDFRKPVMGSLGEVVFATGTVIWYTP